jgi:anti-sigma regulatory factor (Ser/Thr protein kinase)
VRTFGELHELPSRALYSVNLALDEAVTNVVLHGFKENEKGQITIRLTVKGRELSAAVDDDGREFNPLTLPTPDLQAPLETREVGGLGIHLIKSLMDHVEYQRNGDRNLLTMRKRLP